MDCKDREAQISAFIDGELGETERLELMEHMANCEKCSRTYAAFCAVSEAVSDEDAPSDELHGRIMAAVRKDKQANKKRKRAWLSALSAAACIALVLFVGSSLDLFSAADPDAAGDAMITDGEASGLRENGSEITVTTAMSADELASLLSPAADQAATDGAESRDELIRIYDDDENVLLCTVSVISGRVYADFGEGEYMAQCTPDELRAALYD